MVYFQLQGMRPVYQAVARFAWQRRPTFPANLRTGVWNGRASLRAETTGIHENLFAAREANTQAQ